MYEKNASSRAIRRARRFTAESRDLRERGDYRNVEERASPSLALDARLHLFLYALQAVECRGGYISYLHKELAVPKLSGWLITTFGASARALKHRTKSNERRRSPSVQ